VKYIIYDTLLVFQVGDHATSLYIILSGVVKLKTRESFGEPLKTTSTLVAGDSFGELALVKDTQRTATVITTTYTELLMLQKEDYEVLRVRITSRSIGDRTRLYWRFYRNTVGGSPIGSINISIDGT
jgi:CRP-like cAMP-binding protein